MAGWDLLQKRHSLLRTFPVVGHLRYLLEAIGPELRQYIVTDNDHERPFSRDQRRWVYTAAKATDRTFGFGTDNAVEQIPGYLIIRHAAFPSAPPPGEPEGPDPSVPLPAMKVLGGAHGRAKAFRPSSVVNVSAMSFGSLSGAAITALNRGAAMAGSLHTTGEGGVSPAHLNGGDLVWQIGTGYFGCRDDDGSFSLPRLLDQVAAAPSIRAIEIKLSQGAKPGHGGLLPGVKVTPEIAAIRGVPVGVTCRSPGNHSAFSDVDGLLDLVETIAGETGLPVGIKSAVGEDRFWRELTDRMARTGRGVDFVTVDGGEGGTGAAPLVFSDHVALPFRRAFSRVYRTFAEQGLHHDVVFIGSGKLGLPENALLAMAMGCDLVNVGRTAMFAIGCIQSQRCHTGRCPTGVATQSPWLERGLDPTLKSVRCAQYLATLRFELVALARACGVAHPALVDLDAFELLDGDERSWRPRALFGYEAEWGRPDPAEVAEVERLLEAGRAARSGRRHGLEQRRRYHSAMSQRIAVVTGASTGIGRATALRLDREGWRVFAGVRNDDAGEALAQAASSRLVPVRLDVTDEAQVAAAFEQVAEAAGKAGLDGVVNNAGVALGGPLEYLSLERWRTQFEVNVIGQIAVTKAAMPLLRAAKGRIVFIGSNSGRVATPLMGPYSASKFAIEGLADALRMELHGTGIDVVVIEPGAVKTDIWDKGRTQVAELEAELPPEAFDRYQEMIDAIRSGIEMQDSGGVTADKAATVVLRALTASHPRTRYQVGVDAKVSVALARVMPHRAMDAVLRRVMRP